MEKTEIQIDGITYVKKDSIQQKAKNTDGLEWVIIRSYAAGVHYGLLESEKFTESGKVVTLIKTRRIWYWSGAASLSQIALEGVKNPDKCKFSVEIDSNEIVNVIETIPISEKALLNLQKVAVWKK